MNGIYIHVPFCLSKCGYCDFYSITRNLDKGRFAEAIGRELNYRSDYLAEKEIDTIYFGGGTPSLLKPLQLESILGSVTDHFTLAGDHEITLEANPDDLDEELLNAFRSIGINRLSIGIQSFEDQHLKLMNRRHASAQAVSAVRKAHRAGFERISIDLIYGIPGMSPEGWIRNLEQAIALPVGHISAYHLTIEPGTPFARYKREGIISEVLEKESVEQYVMLIDRLTTAGFEMYEISNFARGGAYSRHNLKYWLGGHYLGLGPSAHSFNGGHRHWNPGSLQRYYALVDQGEQPEGEEIDLETARNELVMTRLRTKWGITREEFNGLFGEKEWASLLEAAQPFIRSGDLLLRADNHLVFNPESWFRSDGILARLFKG
ncbi:MAG: radical SAM family heme chaperone HemW [Bacteroidales bacterium]